MRMAKSRDFGSRCASSLMATAHQRVFADNARTAMTPRRVLFVNRFFHPDHSATSQMLSDLSFHLAERGWHVEVVTSRQRYDHAAAKLSSRETVRGVSVRRVWST